MPEEIIGGSAHAIVLFILGIVLAFLIYFFHRKFLKQAKPCGCSKAA